MTKSTHFVRRYIENATISEQGAHAGITKSYEVSYLCFFICKALQGLIFEYVFHFFFIFKKKRFEQGNPWSSSVLHGYSII